MARSKRTRVALGVYRDKSGYSVCWPEAGKQKETRFPPDTPIYKLKDHREQQLARIKATARRAGPAVGLARDVVRFLKRRKGLPSFKSDRSHLRPWVHRFPRKSRFALTAADCAEAVAEWQEAGYSPKEIRHRVRILQQLFHALDGRRAATPLDDLDLPTPSKPRPVSVSDQLVRDVALQLRKQELVGRLHDAKTRARYLVLATTGQRPAQMRRATPDHVDLERRIWFVTPAKGDRGTIVYLNDDMHAAWTLFIQAKAWGAYDGRSFVKTLQRNGWPKGIRPYNLRHTVGLTLSELGVDLGDIQAHMGHSSIETTRTFYVPAIAERMKQASAKLEGRLDRGAVPWLGSMNQPRTKRRKADLLRKTRQSGSGSSDSSRGRNRTKTA